MQFTELFTPGSDRLYKLRRQTTRPVVLSLRVPRCVNIDEANRLVVSRLHISLAVLQADLVRRIAPCSDPRK